jgi:hypothetical protein
VTSKGFQVTLKNLNFALTEAFWYDVNRELLISLVKFFANIHPSPHLLALTFAPPKRPRFLAATDADAILQEVRWNFPNRVFQPVARLNRSFSSRNEEDAGNVKAALCVGGTQPAGRRGEAAMQRLDQRLRLFPPPPNPSSLPNRHLRLLFPESE